MHAYRVLVVDDSPAVLSAVVSLLSTVGGIEVVGTAASGLEALERADGLGPDLVLVDLAMPGINGLEVTRRLASRAERPRVLVMTLHGERAYRDAALRAGAEAVLLKDQLGSELVPVIQSLASRRGDDLA
jgi:DNA-binding NarL/FixJ family response regulator